MRTDYQRIAATIVALGVALSACAPQTAPAPSAGAPPQTERAAVPKGLTLAIQAEPKAFVQEFTLEADRVGGIRQPRPIVHNLLTAENDKNVFIPELAAEPLSIEQGTWQLNPDGTMDTIWRIHPNVKWHDGTPFTTEDLVFAWTVFRDPDVPKNVDSIVRQMVSATPQGPHILAIHWSTAYVYPQRAVGLIPLPRHLLEEAYLADKPSFAKSPRLSTEFIGLGPYRLSGCSTTTGAAGRRWTAWSSASSRTRTPWSPPSWRVEWTSSSPQLWTSSPPWR